MPRINSSGWKTGDLKIHSGTLEDIPNGWELAQDMVDCAVVGAGGQYSKGQQFGADTVATQDHTLTTSQIPSHRHGRNVGSAHDHAGSSGSDASNTTRTNYSHYEGGSGAHHHGNVDVRQKSIAVIWIRKL